MSTNTEESTEESTEKSTEETTQARASAPSVDPVAGAASPVDPPPGPPRAGLGLRGWLGWIWQQFTAMRTALILLFLLALGALPGSLIPQITIDPAKVTQFHTAKPGLSRLYDTLGLFDVYGSAWFAAIYLLLFVSLVGCVLPRVWTYVRAIRSAPPRTPRHLHRLPAHAQVELAGTDPDAVLVTARQVLRKRRFRVVDGTRDGRVSVAAQRGYLHEFGNLVFHLSLVIVLIGLAGGALFGYRGTVLVVTGNGFSNVLSQYDDFSPGRVFDADSLPPFTLTVKSFDVKFQVSGPQRGAARDFNAELAYTPEPGAAQRTYDLRVNHPLHIDNADVFLLGHGYAPTVTVTDGSGKVAYSGPTPFLPQDNNFTSYGAIKAPDASPQALAFDGYFLPTGVIDDQGPHSTFPDDANPLLVLTGYHGPTAGRDDSGSVYEIDTTHLQQFTTANGDKARIALAPGDTATLPNGLGSIRFDGYQRWVKLQVSHTPAQWVPLVGLVLAIAGLMGSLFVTPRRAWVAASAQGGRTVVEVGGMDRSSRRDTEALQRELDAIAAALGPPATGRDGGRGGDGGNDGADVRETERGT